MTRRVSGFIELPRVRTRHAFPLIAGVLLVTPMMLGGALAASIPLSAAVAAAAFALTGVALETVRRDPLVRAWALLAVILGVQLVPLPPSLLALLDRDSAEASARALVALGEDRAGAWRPMHHDPGTGLSDLTYLLGLGAMYIACFTASMRDQLERIYTACASTALIASVVALSHLITDQDLLYGFYRPHQAAPPILSPLLNPNHLAALTGTGVILWTGSATDARNGLVRVLNGVAAVVCGAVCALTLSRGGVAATAGGVAVFLALNARGEGEEERRRERSTVAAQTLTAAVVGTLVFGAGIFVAATSLRQEFLLGDTTKLDIIRRATGVLRGHALLGVGSGALPVVVSTAGRLDPAWTFLRVESLPIDLAIAFGIPAAAFAVYSVISALRRALPPGSAPPTAVAAWCALLTLAVHDLVDFSLFLGGTGYVAAAVAGVVSGGRARQWRRPLERLVGVRRWPGLVALAAVAAVGAVSWRSPLEAERDALERSLRADPGSFASPSTRAALRRHPSDAYLQLLAGSYAVARQDPAGLRFVARAMELSPQWHAPHLLLARVFVARGMRGQAKVELREALRRSAVHAYAVADVALRLSPPLDEAEMDHMAPTDPSGLVFLDFLATRAGTTPEVAAVADTIQLRRDPQALGALRRRAAAARGGGDEATGERLCARLATAHPRRAEGYTCRAEILAVRGDTGGALRLLDTALGRVDDRYDVHAARARLYARLRESGPMRREVAAMLESAGANLDRRILAHGLHGRLEMDIGNDTAAWEAFQAAESLALPEHPYLVEVVRLAARLNDRPALDAACSTLMESRQPDPSVASLCVRAAPAGGPRDR